MPLLLSCLMMTLLLIVIHYVWLQHRLELPVMRKDILLKYPGTYDAEKMTQGSRTLSIITTFETKVAKSKDDTITEIPPLPSHCHACLCDTISQDGCHNLPLINSIV